MKTETLVKLETKCGCHRFEILTTAPPMEIHIPLRRDLRPVTEAPLSEVCVTMPIRSFRMYARRVVNFADNSRTLKIEADYLEV